MTKRADEEDEQTRNRIWNKTMGHGPRGQQTVSGRHLSRVSHGQGVVAKLAAKAAKARCGGR